MSKEKQILCIANLCRGFLRHHDFITDGELDKIQSRIIKYKMKHSIQVTVEELESFDFKQTDHEK